ncbi:ankyrin repeat and lem domain-containing protein 1, partial [Biomphalaria glabrata]
IHKLTNIKKGDFYGISSSWPLQLKRKMGVYLLQKSLQIFLSDGERQICLPDLKKRT